MRTLFSGVLAGGLLIGAIGAQRLVAHEPFAGLMTEIQPPTALLPAPNPPFPPYPVIAPLPPPLPLVPVTADATFDNVLGVTYYTDGALLAATPTPLFPPAGPIPPVIPYPAAVLGAIGGPVTGIAIDPVAGIMFLTSVPGIVVGVAPVPGMPVLVPPFPIPFPTGPIAGLEWDGATGTLWAVDIGGVAFNFFPGGPPAGPPLVSAMVPPGPVGDIAIDKIGTLNGVGLRPIYLCSGPIVWDMTDPGAAPLPAGPLAEGLAFINHPASAPPVGTCPCPPFPGPFNGTAGPMTTGNAAWAIGMTGLAPGSLVVFAFDTVVVPTFPLVNLLGCPLGLSVTPTLLLFPAITDGTGSVVFPISLAGVPVGTGLYNQNVLFCTADPTGFSFSPFQEITVGGF